MKWIYFLLPLLAGIAMSVQSGINAQLKNQLNHSIFASFISFLVGIIPLILILIFQKQPIPSFETLSQVNGWKYIGGLLGAFIVTASLLSITQIGATNMFMIIVTGQLIMALLMDHYGWVGMNIEKISLQKIGGVFLMLAGVYLINKK